MRRRQLENRACGTPGRFTGVRCLFGSSIPISVGGFIEPEVIAIEEQGNGSEKGEGPPAAGVLFEFGLAGGLAVTERHWYRGLLRMDVRFSF